MAARMAVLALVACAFTVVVADPKPTTTQLTPAFPPLTRPNYFDQLRVGFGNEVDTNGAPALKSANLAEVAFTLKRNTLFSPHFHPRGSELFTVASGSFQVFIYANSRLFTATVGPGAAIVFPQNYVHFYYSNPGQKSVAYATLNNRNPGSFFLNDLSKSPGILAGKPTPKEVGRLIRTTRTSTTPKFFDVILSGKTKN